jgi:hypothetical protein
MKCRELISPPLEWPRMKLHKSRSARWLRTPLWPRLAISLALLCVPNTVLAHDIYSGLRDRNGHLCCEERNCKPVEAIGLPDGSYYLPGSDETIPADMAAPSPDDRFHHCAHYPMSNEWSDRWSAPPFESEPKTRCFFAPMNSS